MTSNRATNMNRGTKLLMSNKLIQVILAILIALSVSTSCFAMENMFYILRDDVSPQSLANLKTHAKSINALISQAYHIDEHGQVTGYVNPTLLNFANQNRIKVLALVTNSGFDKVKAQEFLASKFAQFKAIQTLVNLARQNHFAGVQFDFENISAKDKTALTSFYLMAANILHKNGLIVSFAVIPVTNDGQQQSAFLQKKYDNWSGGYDLSELGKSADFITLMAYDQHTQGTTPGPIAGIHWVDAIVKHALQFIPAQKISLGIPAYSGYWFTGAHSEHGIEKISVHSATISYPQVKALCDKNHVKLQWSSNDKVNYAIYDHDWLNHYLFVEDTASFKAKLAIAKKYHLGSISVFRIGVEDPGIWRLCRRSVGQRIFKVFMN
jgi:spore germination protein